MLATYTTQANTYRRTIHIKIDRQLLGFGSLGLGESVGHIWWWEAHLVGLDRDRAAAGACQASTFGCWLVQPRQFGVETEASTTNQRSASPVLTGAEDFEVERTNITYMAMSLISNN